MQEIVRGSIDRGKTKRIIVGISNFFVLSVELDRLLQVQLAAHAVVVVGALRHRQTLRLVQSKYTGRSPHPAGRRGFCHSHHQRCEGTFGKKTSCFKLALVGPLVGPLLALVPSRRFGIQTNQTLLHPECLKELDDSQKHWEKVPGRSLIWVLRRSAKTVTPTYGQCRGRASLANAKNAETKRGWDGDEEMRPASEVNRKGETAPAPAIEAQHEWGLKKEDAMKAESDKTELLGLGKPTITLEAEQPRTNRIELLDARRNLREGIARTTDLKSLQVGLTLTTRRSRKLRQKISDSKTETDRRINLGGDAQETVRFCARTESLGQEGERRPHNLGAKPE